MERIDRSHECLAMAVVPLLPVGTRDWIDCNPAWNFLLPPAASARRLTAKKDSYYIQFQKIIGPVWFAGPWQIFDPGLMERSGADMETSAMDKAWDFAVACRWLNHSVLYNGANHWLTGNSRSRGSVRLVRWPKWSGARTVCMSYAVTSPSLSSGVTNYMSMKLSTFAEKYCPMGPRS